MIEEQRRAAQRLAELQQAAAQVAAAAEARARAEALAQAQAEAAAQAAQAAREEAARREQARQQALAAERAAEQARMASAAAAAANLANQAAAAATPARPGAAMASQALAMARRGMSDLPINPPMNLERPAEPARRTSFLGRNPSEIQLSFYGDSWDEKIRRIGHINYPRIPRDAAYSAVVVAVRIRSDGSLESVNIVNSSGHRELDQATRRIIEMCAPFAAFPPDLRRSFDVVEIRRTLSFPDRPPLLISP
jgi:protein TonB